MMIPPYEWKVGFLKGMGQNGQVEEDRMRQDRADEAGLARVDSDLRVGLWECAGE